MNKLKVAAENVLMRRGVSSTIEVGGITATDKFDKESSMLQFVTRLLNARVEPSYTQPTLNLRIPNYKKEYEVGTLIELLIISEFTQNDAGAVESNSILYNSELLNPGGETSITKTLSVGQGNNEFVNQVRYAEGPIKNDNLGTPSPTGHITAGTLEVRKNIQGVRNAFAISSKTPIELTSDSIRKFPMTYLNPTLGEEHEVQVAEGSQFIAIAYPSSLGDIQSIIQVSLGMNIVSSFDKKVIQVAGANGYAAVDYNVYVYQSLIGLTSDIYKFII